MTIVIVCVVLILIVNATVRFLRNAGKTIVELNKKEDLVGKFMRAGYECDARYALGVQDAKRELEEERWKKGV